MSALFLKHPKETDLALFAGGEAGPFARWRIERHVESCAHCERTVADYFHLADELSVLAETPELDWAAMSADIRAHVANDTEEPQRRGLPAWTWQLGAAAACAVVAVAVLQIGPQAKQSNAPKEERALAEKAQVPQGRLEQKQIAQEINAPVAVAAPAERDAAKENEAMEQPAASARQFARLEAAAEPKPEPLLEKKKDSPAPGTLALADRVDEALPADTAAPPPPAAKAGALKIAAAEADATKLIAEDRRSRDSFTGGRAGIGGAPAPPPPSPAAAFRSISSLAGNVGAAQPSPFRVEALPPAGSDRQVSGDGWISIRAVNADGALTITDVYEPQ